MSSGALKLKITDLAGGPLNNLGIILCYMEKVDATIKADIQTLCAAHNADVIAPRKWTLRTAPSDGGFVLVAGIRDGDNVPLEAIAMSVFSDLVVKYDNNISKTNSINGMEPLLIYAPGYAPAKSADAEHKDCTLSFEYSF